MRRIVIISIALCLHYPQAHASEDGGRLYRQRCAVCHGSRADQKIMSPVVLTTLTSEKIISALKASRSATTASAATRAKSALTDAQTEAVAAYIVGLKKDDTPKAKK